MFSTYYYFDSIQNVYIKVMKFKNAKLTLANTVNLYLCKSPEIAKLNCRWEISGKKDTVNLGRKPTSEGLSILVI